MSVEIDPVDPDADSKRQAHERTENAKARAAESDDWAGLMSTANGRRIVWRLLELAGVYRTSLSAGQPDVTAFNEGQRNIGLFIVAKVNEHAPDKFMTMREEAQTR